MPSAQGKVVVVVEIGAMGRIVELVSIVVIAVAVGVGGRALLEHIAHFRLIALVVLVAWSILQIGALRRNYGAGGPNLGLRATRDVVFLVAALLAVAYVFAPARWSLGACIVSIEFGLIIELLEKLTPGQPA
ncbi:MAG: hypothetical protein ACREM8_12685 [Vulcanimicrobiaceae bacterium]